MALLADSKRFDCIFSVENCISSVRWFAFFRWFPCRS